MSASATATAADPPGEDFPAGEQAKAFLKDLVEHVSANRDKLKDREFLAHVFRRLHDKCMGDLSFIMALLLAAGCDREDLVRMFKGIREELEKDRSIAWVVSGRVGLDGADCPARHVMVKRPGTNGAVAEPYLILDVLLAPAMAVAGRHVGPSDTPPPPFLALVSHKDRVFLGRFPASAPQPALPAEYLEAVAASPDAWPDMGEVELTRGMEERNFPAPADKSIAREIAERLARGETVTVRYEGIVRSIYDARGRALPEWVQQIPPDAAALQRLIWPDAELRAEAEADVDRLARRDVGFRIAAIGPTGTGKTVHVDYVLAAAAAVSGRAAYRLDASLTHIGTALIHGVTRNLAAVFKMGRRLVDEGHIVAILLDEGDAIAGEPPCAEIEHSHEREERLSLQQLLSADPPGGMAVYLTMNVRQNSFLAAPIYRRFAIREFPRPHRGQMAEVAAMYADPEAMARLGLSAREFGALLADQLYSPDRVVARATFHSGRTLPVRVRDLRHACPGTVRDLVLGFCRDLVDGKAGGLEALWGRLDRRFRLPLSERNLYALTFCTPPPEEDLKRVQRVD